jgi:hypothetical protein
MIMFSLSYSSPCEVQGTIQLSKRPSGLGFYTDIHGERWDVRGIIGEFVQACKVDNLHPSYTDTSGTNNYGLVSQKWKPYAVEVVK